MTKKLNARQKALARLVAADLRAFEGAAESIVARLFTAGNGEAADRLVLTSEDGRDLGGWGRGPVLDLIVDALIGERE